MQKKVLARDNQTFSYVIRETTLCIKKDANQKAALSNLRHKLCANLQESHNKEDRSGCKQSRATVGPRTRPVQILRISLQDTSSTGSTSEHAESNNGKAHAQAGSKLGLIRGQAEEANRRECDEDSGKEAEEQCLYDQATETLNGDVAENEDGADESAGNNYVNWANFVGQDVG